QCYLVAFQMPFPLCLSLVASQVRFLLRLCFVARLRCSPCRLPLSQKDCEVRQRVRAGHHCLQSPTISVYRLSLVLHQGEPLGRSQALCHFCPRKSLFCISNQQLP